MKMLVQLIALKIRPFHYTDLLVLLGYYPHCVTKIRSWNGERPNITLLIMHNMNFHCVLILSLSLARLGIASMIISAKIASRLPLSRERWVNCISLPSD
jgi:hypothetical protein